jgi:CRP-like cAMP-binding protein
VVVAAAAELADSGRAEDVAAAQAAIGRLTLESGGSAAAGRRDAADALARIRNPACRSLLVPLLHDRDPEVARAAISSARALGPGDAVFVPALVSRLGHRVLKRAARGTLVSYGEEVVPVLAHLLADPHEQPWVRRHIPGTLSRIPVQASMDALFAVVTDPDGFLRYKIVTAIETLHRRHPTLSIRPDAVERLIVRESARYYTYLTLRFNLIQQGDGARRTLAVVALEDKLARTLDRLYRELGLLYPWQDVAAARRAIESGDARARANALEFLDTLLSSALRRRVMPILDEMPMSDKVRVANSLLKTRPRGLDETLVQLVHDDDPVVAASAIEMVVQQAIDTLDDDLEFVVTRGTADGIVIDAATWARTVLAERRATGRREVRARPLPDVRLADRLRAIPLFARVSVDELFRVAATARQIAHDRGRDLAARGAAATDVWLLVEGTVRLRNGDEPLGIITAPAALALEEALEGRPLGYTMTALDAMVCLALPVGDLLTMLSDNIAMAQGLFRTLLTDRRTPGADWLPAGRDVVPAAVPAGPLTAVDKARLLRQNPLFCRASVEHLLALSAVTREVGLPAGTALPRERESIAAFHLLQGEVRIDDDGTGPRVVGPGGTVFVEETLAGTSPRYRAMVTREGRALRLDHEDLFDVLADHTDLLQDVFSGIVGARRA